MNKQRGDSELGIIIAVLFIVMVVLYVILDFIKFSNNGCKYFEYYPKNDIPVRCYKELGL